MNVDKVNSYQNKSTASPAFSAKLFCTEHMTKFAPTIRKTGGKFVLDCFDLKSEVYFNSKQLEALKLKFREARGRNFVDIMLEPEDRAQLELIHKSIRERTSKDFLDLDIIKRTRKLVEETGLYDAWMEILDNTKKFSNNEITRLQSRVFDIEQKVAVLKEKPKPLW